MNYPDLFFIFQWWFMFFIFGAIFFPLTKYIFSKFFDQGYIFSKVLGATVVSYLIFLLGLVHLISFTRLNSIFILIFLGVVNFILLKKIEINFIKTLKEKWKIFLFEEVIFLILLTLLSFIRGFQPNINGLEKFMDFGFINSILRAEYFPPKDMWFTPFSINYYYFGHLTTAVLTKISGIPSSITYNLMLATIFSLGFTAAFSIGLNLINSFLSRRGVAKVEGFPTARSSFELARLERALAGRKLLTGPRATLISGLLTGFLVIFAGNLHTIYTFFKPYQNENPVPFWQLLFSPATFPNSYWYPNATRFIHNTIHEFPSYSFAVSDLHGHVLDIPIVLMIIGILLNELFSKKINNLKYLLVSFLLAIAYMTNVWDGLIYLLLAIFVLVAITVKYKFPLYNLLFTILIVVAGLSIFSFPFSLNFKPFVSGIGVLCAPDFLTDIGKIGPFLFEKDHCQRSPFWQLLILYGFFYFWVFLFLLKILQNLKINNWKFIENLKLKIENLNAPDLFILLLVLLSTILIIIPEFFYIKDIYPAHYRANTMFKLVYQSFIMLSIASAYIAVRFISNIKYEISKIQRRYTIFNFYYVYLLFTILFFILVMVYPYFAINSYYENLNNYRGLDGIKYLKNIYPADYEAILWLNKNIKGQPVILEAQGDSYTDYARVSANTGLPTVLGWTVHEWLWRGTYDIPAPRITEVQTLYESENINQTRMLIKKYDIAYIFIGTLERQKYQKLNEEKFETLGKIVYQNGSTKIYQINL